MKKLSLALALIMIIAVIASTLGITGFAASTSAVASIGNATYADLHSAFAALKDGDTLKLLKDVTLAKGEALTLDGAVRSASSYNAFEYLGAVTIDGNGNTISAMYGSDGTILTIKDIAVTIKNLTLKSTHNGIVLEGQANVTLNNCNVYAGGVQEGTIPGQDAKGKPAAWGTSGMALNIPQSAPLSTLVINGGKVVSSGTVTFDEVRQTWTYGGMNRLIENRGGTLIINDGEFISYNGTNLLQVGGQTPSNGQTAEYCASQIASTCWIYGGTFVQATAQADHTVQTRIVCAFKGAAINIFGGNFINNQIMSKSINGTVIGGHSSPGFVSIFGGNFYSLGNGNINELFAKDPTYHFLKVYGGNFYATPKTEIARSDYGNVIDVNANNDNFLNGYYQLIEAAEAGKYNASAVTEQYVNVPFINTNVLVRKMSFSYNASTAKIGAVAQITNPNGSVYYAENIYEAFNIYAMDGATIKLLSNVNLNEELIIVKHPVDLKIDGNGKKISVTNPAIGNAIRIEEGTYEFSNITVENNYGSAFSFGYTPIGGETIDFATYKVNVALTNSTIKGYTAEIAYVVKSIYNGTFNMRNVVINGAAPVTKNIVFGCNHTETTSVVDDKYIASPANCITPALYYKCCKDCGIILRETFEVGEPTSHSWSSRWSADSNTHFHACTYCGTVKTDIGEHTYGNWEKYTTALHTSTCTICGYAKNMPHIWDTGVITTPPTHTARGTKTFTCIDCGDTRTESVDKLAEHVYGDGEQYSADLHKKTCPCGDVQYAPHIWDEGVVTTQPTHLTQGVKTFTCTDCGATRTESVDRSAVHDYGEWEQYSSDWHQGECVCGHIQYAPHIWNEGVVTVEPTVDAEGEKTFTCTDCQTTKVEPIQKLTNSSGNDQNDQNNQNDQNDQNGCNNTIFSSSTTIIACATAAMLLCKKKKKK